jgi:hypothetical protein
MATTFEGAPQSALEPDTDGSIDFLKRWAPEGPWVLTAIPQEGGKPDVETFTPETVGAMRTWVEDRNGRANLYFTVNPLLRGMRKKASREDVKELAWLHVDIDPRAAEPLEDERARIRALLTTNLPDGVPAPTVVIFSGGGFQAFWKLEGPLRIDGDLDRAEEAKCWNLQLERLFDADSCHNVDRIMRLPGTINLPDAKKGAKGRAPALAELVKYCDDRIYSLDDFSPAAAPPTVIGGTRASKVEVDPDSVRRLADVDDLDEWRVPDRVKAIVVQGHLRDVEGPKERDDSRSAWLFDAVCGLVRWEVPDEVILGAITDPDLGWPRGSHSPRRVPARASRPPSVGRREAFHLLSPQVSQEGALTVHYAQTTPEDDSLSAADAVVLLSPGIRLSITAALAVWHKRIVKLLGLEKLPGRSVLPEYDPFKYPSFSMVASHAGTGTGCCAPTAVCSRGASA